LDSGKTDRIPGKRFIFINIVGMYIDYSNLVIQEYRRKKEENQLSLNLMLPSPAKLRDECLQVCEHRYMPKDEKALKLFFGRGDDKATFLRVIERCKADKFRPLVNHLNNGTESTEPKNVELLAWLIDFKDRPFDLGKQYALPAQVVLRDPSIVVEETRLDEEGPDEEESMSGMPHIAAAVSGRLRPKFKLGLIGGFICVLFFLGTGSYWIYRIKMASGVGADIQKCMYWDGDHYEPISCNEKFGDAIAIALDTDKVEHFRKILRSDTITEASIGKLWYVRYNGDYEFYTSDGYHPLDPRLRLKPLTAFIIRKHVHYLVDGEPMAK
jgi:hypothetical protein